MKRGRGRPEKVQFEKTTLAFVARQKHYGLEEFQRKA
jgi:hypothetical protein